jgi:hypothetical protein
MDEFLFLTDSYHDALLLRQRVEALLDSLGLQRNPKKGVWTPTQVGDHLRLIVDLQLGMFRAPPAKLLQLAQQASSSLLRRAASNARWLPTRQLATFAGKAQSLYLAIAPARFFLREVHNVLATRRGWGGLVRLTHQLRRDLEWWRTVPSQNNGRSIYKPVETAYLHADSSDYGWGAVLNDDPNYQARGFWSATDRLQHIAWKELRAVRHAVESFLPQLKGRQVLLHEDNTAVVADLTKLTSRSPVMMTELRRLWYLLDTNDIHIRPRYIRLAANVWADTLSRTLGTCNSIPAYSRTFKHGGAPILSTGSRPCSTPSSRGSTPDGGTPNARTSTAYAFPTPPGAAKTTTATRLGPPYRHSPPNWTNHKRQRPSSPPTGQTRRGITPLHASPPRPCIT